MRVTRAAIVLAGGEPLASWVVSRLPVDAFVIAADSGVHLAPALGRAVDLAVGDFDSADPDAVAAAVRAGAVVEAHPAEKDATDLELALAAAAARGHAPVHVVGVGGGRLDHFLANVAVLASPRFAALHVEAYAGVSHLAVAHGGEPPVTVHGRPGDLLTLLTCGGPAHGVTTKGLQYALHGEDLTIGTSRGVSNVFVDDTATVSLASGTLLVVVPEAGR